MDLVVVDSIKECQWILEQIPEELPKLGSVETHSQFIIKEQIEDYNHLRSKIQLQVQKLLQQLQGKKILDPLSEIYLKSIEIKQVPLNWRKTQDFSTLEIDVYVQKFIDYTNYFKQRNGSWTNTYWLPAIRNPAKLLKALMYEFSLKSGCSSDSVGIEVSILKEEPDISYSENGIQRIEI